MVAVCAAVDLTQNTGMKIIHMFLDPATGVLRGGWRALCFGALAIAPYLLLSGLAGSDSPQSEASLEVSAGMFVVYLFLIGWLLFVSWFCLRVFERMGFRSLGLAPHEGWLRDVAKGFGLSGAMIAAVVGLQWAGGGSRVRVNPVFWDEPAAVVGQVLAALLLLIAAAAYEEIAFRGFAFQTLLRGAPAVVPIALLSVFFGLVHWDNPSRTVFSTLNTVLAGVWLSIAYLRTRSLWFPIALHTGWNWAMGAIFGLPVSGLLIPRRPLLLSTSGEPLWLTGGGYGSEGGAAATLVFLLGTALVWRAPWLRVAPATTRALSSQITRREEPVRLGLEE
jgi:uncharacterized protein